MNTFSFMDLRHYNCASTYWKKSIILFVLGFFLIFQQNVLVNANGCGEERKVNMIYKILTPKEWDDFKESGNFTGSALDIKDGFIHAAFNDQYPRLLNKFFEGIRPVVLVSIDVSLLQQGSLIVEANKKGGEKYPHVYDAIPHTAVIAYEFIN